MWTYHLTWYQINNSQIIRLWDTLNVILAFFNGLMTNSEFCNVLSLWPFSFIIHPNCIQASYYMLGIGWGTRLDENEKTNRCTVMDSALQKLISNSNNWIDKRAAHWSFTVFSMPDIEEFTVHVINLKQDHIICWFYLFFKNYLFIYYFWLCWVFIAVHGLSPVSVSGPHPHGFSSCRAWAVGIEGFRSGGSTGLSDTMACGIFPDQGSNWCPLHCKANS